MTRSTEYTLNGRPGSTETRPGPSLLASLRGSKIPEVLRDVAEMGIDAALQEGVIREIPILKWITGLHSALVAVRDYFLLKKVIRFLNDLNELPQAEREDLITRIDEDDDFADRIAESLIQYLDRYDHIDNAGLLTKVFCAYGKGQIDGNEFMRLAASIDQAYMRDLELLLDYFKAEDPKGIDILPTKRNLFSSDLSDFYVLTHQEMQRAGFEHPQVYHFNKRGQTLASIVLGRKFRGDR